MPITDMRKILSTENNNRTGRETDREMRGDGGGWKRREGKEGGGRREGRRDPPLRCIYLFIY